jgi:hypothetical protein
LSKLIQALLSGMFFTFILDFFIFLGIKINYIDFYEIDLYYNILFADNQNIFIFTLFSIIIGWLVIYLDSYKIKLWAIGLMFLLSFSTLIHPIGNSLAKIILMQKKQVFRTKMHTFVGDIYYNGREKITFYDYDLKKIIILNKKELLQ